MGKNQIVLTLLVVLLAGVSGWLWSRVTGLEKALQEAGQPDLYMVMNSMQAQQHKLYYAIEAENADLTDFYLHELEEASEDLIDADLHYDGYPVGRLTESMLIPVIEGMEDDLDQGHWDRLREKRTVLAGTCNSCHAATDHGYIRITERGEVNPFNQDFSTR